MIDFDDDDEKCAALREELSQPSDWAFTGAVPPPIEREPEPEDPFKTYGRENIRTTIPPEEHDDVRPTDTFRWIEKDEDGDGPYYLWSRREPV